MTIYCIKDESAEAEQAAALMTDRLPYRRVVLMCGNRESTDFISEEGATMQMGWSFKGILQGHTIFVGEINRWSQFANMAAFCKGCQYVFIKRYLLREEE